MADLAQARNGVRGSQPLVVRFSPAGLFVLCLFVQGWFVILHVHLAGHNNPGVAILGQAFDILRETSLPTIWAFLQALAVAAVAAVIVIVLRCEGAAKDRRIGWMFAAALFAVIAIDDAAGFHERLGAITSLDLMAQLGYPIYPWHIVVAPILGGWLLLVLYLLWNDLKSVPGCRLMVAIGLACFGLSQGIDFVEGVDRMSRGALEALAVALPWWMIVEEVLEMIGTALFLCAFATFLKSRVVGMTLVVSADEEPEEETARASTGMISAAAVTNQAG